MIDDMPGTVEPSIKNFSVNVPFPAMIISVTCRFEEFGKKGGPGWPFALPASFGIREFISSDFLGIITGQQGAAGGPAPAGVVELRISQTIGGKRIEVWGLDFAPVTTQV